MEAVLKKELILNKTLCRVFGVLIFIILTGLGAFVRIPLPFTPVPLTLQTFFVLLSGALLGANLGAASQAGYIFLGLVGLPIFTAAGGGLFYLLGPTGGYLFGFMLAALFVGRFVRGGRDNLFSVFGILCIADLILLACGVIWLRFLFGYSLRKLLFIGFLPFLAGDLVKAFFASIIYLRLKNRIREIL